MNFFEALERVDTRNKQITLLKNFAWDASKLLYTTVKNHKCSLRYPLQVPTRSCNWKGSNDFNLKVG